MPRLISRVLSRKNELILLALTAALTLAGNALAAPADKEAPAPEGGGSLFQKLFYVPEPLGQTVVVVLVIASVANVALIIQHSLRCRRSAMVPEDVALNIEQLLTEKKYREAIELTANEPSFFSKVVHEAMSQASYGYNSMQQAVEDTGTLMMAERVRAIEPLNILGAVGPMAGLVGTVYGMITGFEKVGAGKPELLAGSIATALKCTLWGLVVAVPALIAYGMIRTKVEGMSDVAMGRAMRLIAPFRPAAARRTAQS